jgi:hypothetical protein
MLTMKRDKKLLVIIILIIGILVVGTIGYFLYFINQPSKDALYYWVYKIPDDSYNKLPSAIINSETGKVGRISDNGLNGVQLNKGYYYTIDWIRPYEESQLGSFVLLKDKSVIDSILNTGKIEEEQKTGEFSFDELYICDSNLWALQESYGLSKTETFGSSEAEIVLNKLIDDNALSDNCDRIK